ncbi:outer surface protein VlsE (plasmid) [Borreliella finlandensis]|uniref:Variable large protein n=1 Tax=Borreliella finlandensis TaxID=498741 RepID=A0A826H140_9SPIR|nr:variable large family protein [Borreliella finlandensis]EEH00262.1 outer surface protein VlsE [Borreliella finlandensis]
MKKISSAILLIAFIAFINCKSNAGEVSTNDPEKEFYQSIIKLGNGFLDVFTSFGGLVADAFGLKADPKKSEVQKYFNSIATKLETTISSLASLPKENGGGTKDQPGKDTANNTGSAVESAIKEISEKLKAIAEAAKKAAGAAGSDETSIGNVVNAGGAGAGGGAADTNSVKGIANGMKAIVDAAEKAAGAGKEEKKELLKAAGDGAATGTDNAGAGHLFSGANGAGQGASDAQAQKAAGAINAVSGEQILKEIVDAAKNGGAGAGAAAAEATNPISAAIGAAAQGGAFGNGMDQNSKVAAAIVLRGMAKDGKFAVNNDNQKDGVKSAVESGVNKTILALTGIVKEAVDAGLKTIVTAVKGASDAGAGAAHRK